MVGDKQRRNWRSRIGAQRENDGTGGEPSAIDEHSGMYGHSGLGAIGKVPGLDLSKGPRRGGQIGQDCRWILYVNL